MNEKMMDTIVNKVLFQLCKIKRVLMIEGFNYPSEDIEIIQKDHFVECMASIDDVLGVLSGSKMEQQTEVWLPSLSCKELMAASLGIGGDQISDALLVLLLRGYRVYISASKIEFMQIEASETPLYKRHKEALELLFNSGLTTETITKQSKKIIFTEKLLVEESIKDYVNNGCKEIYVSNKTIITPMAQDYLRQSKVTIVRE